MITSASADVDYLMSRRIIVPVAGADMAKVEDTLQRRPRRRRAHASRDRHPRAARHADSLGRRRPDSSHDDEHARRHLACTPSISQNRLVYYYAHMDHYNDAMSPGREIVKGDTLGFVGTTGNAPKDTPHLHFQVMRWPADGKYWNGEPIDPFEALGGLTRSERARHSQRTGSYEY